MTRYDVVLLGATGFVGKLVTAHLAEHAPPELRVALAGRSRERLRRVRETHGRPGWDLTVADSTDLAAMRSMAGSARVVLTTVGPYARLGMAVLQACAETGTDYVDLTGEVIFVREAIDRHHTTAERTGARIVVSCGFDSIPSDLAVHLLHRHATTTGMGELADTTLAVTRLKGGLSGGTLDSMRAQLAVVHADPEAARLARDPYALAPDPETEPRLTGQRDRTDVFREEATGHWAAPFVMAAYNTRLVRRSHALVRELGRSDDGYGARFRYRELVDTGPGARGLMRAHSLRTGLGALAIGLTTPGLSRLTDRVLPSPGHGPSERVRAAGCFEMRVRARTSSGASCDAVVAAQGDPGYAATSRMVGQAALALAVDGGRCHPGGGVLTPAVALGDVLVERLREQGFRLEVG